MMQGDATGRAGNTNQRDLIDAAWVQVEPIWSTLADATTVAGRTGPIPPGDAPAIRGYRLEGEIHRGGQGVVYRGVQESTRRTVAIKVMRDGVLATPQARFRFEREVRILAQLKHPNIVTIHDSGTQDGYTYFVMDYIAGLPLDDHVKQHNVELRDRLRLLARIAEAVDVAHVRGIIHRDLKPGNIRIDAAGEPHVLDFGLAKHAEFPDDHDPHTAISVTGQFIGSMPWASPEQAEGRQERVDVRTDVYALGVMLYQLLTGTFPYDVSGSLMTTARTIIERDPTPPRRLNRQLDDETATIVLKALRKDRDARYQSAGALARDLQRYLKGEPIEAKRDSVSYLLRKQIRRHRGKAAVAAGFSLLVIAGLIVSVTLWGQAVAARDAEETQRRAAERHKQTAEAQAAEAHAAAARARAVTEFLTSTLGSANPTTGIGVDVTVREALDQAVNEMEGSLRDQPAVRASVEHAIGRTYAGLGFFDRARVLIENAIATYTELGRTYQRDLFECRNEWTNVLIEQGELLEAERTAREVLAESRATFGPNNAIAVTSLNLLARLKRSQDQSAEAVALHQEALAMQHQLTDEPSNLATTMNDLAIALQSQGKLDESIEIMNEALAIAIKAHGPDHYDVAVSRSNLANMYAHANRLDEAEQLYRLALVALRRRCGGQHPKVASCIDSLGRLYVRKRDFDRAAELQREAMAIRRTTLGDDHPLVAHSLNNLAVTLYHQGDLDEAVRCYDEAIAIFTQAEGERTVGLATMMSNQAAIMLRQGRAEEAIPVLREALAVRLAHLGEDHPAIAEARNNLGRTLMDIAAYEEAETLLRAAFRQRQAQLAPDDPKRCSTADNLARALREQHKLSEAENIARDTLAIRQAQEPTNPLEIAASLNLLGLIRQDQGHLDEAVDLLTQAVELSAEHQPAGHWQTGTMWLDLGVCLQEAKEYAQAEAVLMTAYEIFSAQFDNKHRVMVKTIEAIARAQEATGNDIDAQASRPRLTSP